MIARRLVGWPSTGWQNQFSQIEQMRRDMARISSALFGGPQSGVLPSGVFPAVNIHEDKENFYIRAELPGISNQDLDLQVTGRNLSIAGERNIESQGDGVRYHRKEREAGKFNRVIGLPGDIDADKIDAKVVNGMLTITLPKSEAAKPRQIAVN
jgi:HSP20 family protein